MYAERQVIHSFIHSFRHSFIHSFVCFVIIFCACIHLFMQYVCACMCMNNNSFIKLLNYPIFHSLILFSLLWTGSTTMRFQLFTIFAYIRSVACGENCSLGPFIHAFISLCRKSVVSISSFLFIRSYDSVSFLHFSSCSSV